MLLRGGGLGLTDRRERRWNTRQSWCSRKHGSIHNRIVWHVHRFVHRYRVTNIQQTHRRRRNENKHWTVRKKGSGWGVDTETETEGDKCCVRNSSHSLDDNGGVSTAPSFNKNPTKRNEIQPRSPKRPHDNQPLTHKEEHSKIKRKR